MIYSLGIILQLMFLLSGLAIISKGFVKPNRENHFVSIMIFSGLFGTILSCLADGSNIGFEIMSYMSLALGVLALVCAFVANFIDKCETKKNFWFLALFLIPIGLLCYWCMQTQEYIFEKLIF